MPASRNPVQRRRRFTPEEAAALKAAFRQAQGSATLAPLLGPPFLALLEWHGIQALVRAGSPDLDDEALQASAAAVAARNALRLRDAAAALGALASSGVKCVALKGLSLIVRGYENPGLRPMSDLDVLIAEDDMARADRTLLELGYRRAVTQSPELAHHMAYRLRDDAELPDTIELHRRLFEAPPYDLRVPSEDILERATRGPDSPIPGLFQPDPVDLALHIAGHTAIQHAGAERLIWVADLDRAVRVGLEEEARTLEAGSGTAADPAADGYWTRLWHRAHGWDLAPALEDCLTAAGDWFGTPIDVRWVSARERARYETARSRAPVGLEGARLVHDLRAARTWRARSSLAREALLPSPEFVRRWYGVDDSWRMPAVYARRWASGARDVVRARSTPPRDVSPSGWFVDEAAPLS